MCSYFRISSNCFVSHVDMISLNSMDFLKIHLKCELGYDKVGAGKMNFQKLFFFIKCEQG